MTRQNRFGGNTHQRRDRLIQEETHDTYRTDRKFAEPTVCRECGAAFQRGRWTWARERPQNAHEQTCPACRRVRDAYPAGFVLIGGSFFGEHRDEITNLVHNQAEKENAEHPMKRIMNVQETSDGVTVTTTDSHLARSIGDALERAYEGKLDYEYSPQDEMLRVSWKRDL